ncbi:MAG: gamma-glutamylcyclotransferase [Alphaproteobacteria bacterium]
MTAAAFLELSPEAKQISLQGALRDLPPGDPWIFGYGSLMWNPGFPFRDKQPAVVYGFHRAFCVQSFRYRGTPQKPGLVLGLDRGGSCRGFAFHIPRMQAEETLSYLWQREMITGVYAPRFVRVQVLTSTRSYVQALTFIANPHHPQYMGNLTMKATAKCIAEACGEVGDCCDYLERTVAHLDQLGIPDGAVHRLFDAVKTYRTKR